MTRIKICGITSTEDADACVRAGVDALGFVFAESPRRIEPDEARRIVADLPPMVTTVGVFVDAEPDRVQDVQSQARVDVVQLHGRETPGYCEQLEGRVIKRFDLRAEDTGEGLRARLETYRVSAYLLDPGAGDGKTFSWELARGIDLPLIIAGGLTAENVAQAVRLLRPYAVDVCSGVEREPGRKDPDKIRVFVDAVRSADAG